MQYSKVLIDAIGYEIAPVVVTSIELERRLKDLYATLHLGEGQLESLTGIHERRWWEPGYRISDGAIAAAERALAASSVKSGDLDVLIYGGVCREYFEPATACRVASGLGISPGATVYDISNACLGVLNGILEVAEHVIGSRLGGLAQHPLAASGHGKLRPAKLPWAFSSAHSAASSALSVARAMRRSMRS